MAARNPAAPSKLLTLAEVLAELRVSRSTFDTWRTLGTAPKCIKLPNGRIRVYRDDLDAWLSTRAEVAGAV